VEEDESRDPKVLVERIDGLEKENAQLQLNKKAMQDEIEQLCWNSVNNF